MIPSKVEDLTVQNKGNLIFDPGPPLALTVNLNLSMSNQSFLIKTFRDIFALGGQSRDLC